MTEPLLNDYVSLPDESVSEFSNKTEILTALEKARPQFKWK